MEKNQLVARIFKDLLSHFGPQHWWPVTLDGEISPKYHKRINLTEKQKLEICFGAILAQNTSWKNVEKAVIQLNKNNLINVNKILKINNKRLAGIIKSSGYHNQKAEKLKNFCEFLIKDYNGTLGLMFQNDIGELRKQLLSVNGIGPETADSIMLYAAKNPIFVVDAYTKRISGRIGLKESSYADLQALFMESLPNSEKLFNEYHALLVGLGKSLCKKLPLCGNCPISMQCDYSKKAGEKWRCL